MTRVAAAPRNPLLAHAVELERRDEAVAEELARVRDLEARAAAVRERAGEVGDALERLPLHLEDLAQRRREAETEATTARIELERAASHLAALESGRRRRDDELERARKEAATARDALADALARGVRISDLESALRAKERALLAETEELSLAATRIAADLQGFGRVAEAAGRAPGETLADLDDWGGQVRSALFVARGTLEAERERIVMEANVLGTSVLGEQLGASSVALVRRRLESHLAR